MDSNRSIAEGRMDTAFLLSEGLLWGKFRFEENTLEVHGQDKPRDDHLFNLVAASYHFNSGGKLHCSRPRTRLLMSSCAVFAGIMRSSMPRSASMVMS